MRKLISAILSVLLLALLCGCAAEKEAPSVSVSEVYSAKLNVSAEALSDNNLVSGGDFSEGLPSIGGTETVVNKSAEWGLFDPEDEGNYVLKCDTTSDWEYIQLGKHQFEVGHTYIVGYRINVERYEQGLCGVQTIKNTYQEGVTNGWVCKTVLCTVKDADRTFNTFVGSMEDPSLTCYIDDLVIVDLSELTEMIPTEEQVQALYEEYIALIHG